jgi:hypothetical protein
MMPGDAEHHPIRQKEGHTMCSHQPVCPQADACDHDAARIVASHPEQGWHLLCNGVLIFDDNGELLPDGRALAPRRVAPPQAA